MCLVQAICFTHFPLMVNEDFQRTWRDCEINIDTGLRKKFGPDNFFTDETD